MKQNRLTMALVALMLLCAVFLAAWAPLMRQRSFQLEDALLSLETSQGRERKQQHEYDEVSAALPEAREELALLQPQAEAAAEKVAELKAERKALREQKKALEEAIKEAPEEKQAEAAPPEEVSPP